MFEACRYESRVHQNQNRSCAQKQLTDLPAGETGMNTLTTDCFVAECHPSGEITIKAHYPFGAHVGIICSKQEAEKLARFILSKCDNKVDYSRCAGEPE